MATALQNITWIPPTSGEVLYYLVRYEMQGNTAPNATVNTTSTSVLLSLLLEPHSQNMVTYIIWVAVVTPSNEQGLFSELIVNYSSKCTELKYTATDCIIVIVRM